MSITKHSKRRSQKPIALRWPIHSLCLCALLLVSCTTSNSADSSQHTWEGLVQAIWVLISAVAVVIIYLYREFDRQSIKYQNCAKDIQSDNETVRVTAAILFRSFLQGSFLARYLYKDDTKRLLIALLSTMDISHMQKTLADSISFFDNADGMDFQKVNLHDASIKPKYRINYELTGKRKYIDRQIDIQCADFFMAIITFANINNINFFKSIFVDAIMTGSRFHHCNFANANFKRADMQSVRFDNCNLIGANFNGALHIDSIRYEIGVEGTEGYLCYQGDEFISMLDKDGIFKGNKQEDHYELTKKKNTIFVSKLGIMDTRQLERYNRVMDHIKRTYTDINIVQINREDYRDLLQLDDVISRLNDCDGVIIFAFSYMTVTTGTIHEHVSGKDKKKITDKEYTSPWLQIETAIARSKNKPCLIVHTPEIVKDGMFDEMILKSDNHIYPIEYDEPFPLHKHIIEDWYREVEKS